MDERYFNKNEDFDSIIANVLKSNDVLVTKISTGWTNAVFKAFSNGKYYIFRFPRNNYWSDVIENEYHFNQFLTTKTTIPTSKMNLLYNNDRPFSYHEMIEGETLADIYSTLTSDEKSKIAMQIAKFLIEFQKINLLDVPMKIDSTSKFLENLSKIEKNEYDLSKHDFLLKKETEETQVISHGDLNAGNILIDKNKNICAVLDFAFISKSSKITDIARIIGRLPCDFSDIMIDAYNTLSLEKVTASDVKQMISVYDYVDAKYIEFMKNYYPEVSLPN